MHEQVPTPTQKAGQAGYLLGRIVEEAQRAQGLPPREQAEALAQLIQPYTGWALSEAVVECRGQGMTWATLAPDLGLTQAQLSRQVRANGP
ncbi:hypothetical protein WKI65_44235, partial [Streptomyces sp. MS1.AVA.3]|uniref:hypothetical protein n=1 Tax=Streptomyces decoyicus TaxID=249567 RepID=UPI0030C0C713